MVRLARRLWLIGFLLPLVAFADAEKLVAAAQERTTVSVIYDGAYQSIAYPLGDVAADRGVCTDLVIRSYRRLGIDLQQLVHEDMTANFALYPNLWGLSRPDSNIDHRRVPNLQTFFTRYGQSFAIDDEGQYAQFKPGDLVTWMLPGNLPHIGIVSDKRSADGKRPLIIHNIGRGPKEEDAINVAPITGHYRYFSAIRDAGMDSAGTQYAE